MREHKSNIKSQKSLIYRKMDLNNINPRLKENQVVNVQIFKNHETGERGWRFETRGGNFGKVILFKGFEYKDVFYPKEA